MYESIISVILSVVKDIIGEELVCKYFFLVGMIVLYVFFFNMIGIIFGFEFFMVSWSFMLVLVLIVFFYYYFEGIRV